MSCQINIRVACLADAQQMLALQREVIAEEQYFISTVTEFQQTVEGTASLDSEELGE